MDCLLANASFRRVANCAKNKRSSFEKDHGPEKPHRLADMLDTQASNVYLYACRLTRLYYQSHNAVTKLPPTAPLPESKCVDVDKTITTY